MFFQNARVPLRLFVRIIPALAFLSSCGGGGEQGDTGTPGGGAAGAVARTAGGTVARADFVLCPPIEAIADSLASIVGFTRDPDRAVQGIAGQCFVRGESGGFIGIELAPAAVPSIAMQAEGYDSESRPAPDLGSEAAIIADGLQPHVIFRVRGQIIDVGAE